MTTTARNRRGRGPAPRRCQYGPLADRCGSAARFAVIGADHDRRVTPLTCLDQIPYCLYHANQTTEKTRI